MISCIYRTVSLVIDQNLIHKIEPTPEPVTKKKHHIANLKNCIYFSNRAISMQFFINSVVKINYFNDSQSNDKTNVSGSIEWYSIADSKDNKNGKIKEKIMSDQIIPQ